jgi:hypothetical protein
MNLTMIARSLALAVSAIAILTLSQGVARADEVTLTGVTTGSVTGVPQLTFAGNSFTGTTALGIGALSGVNSLGTFALNTDSLHLVAGTFTLNIAFTSPAGINGGQSVTYLATIQGSVSPNVDQGGVNIHFIQPLGGTVFTFTNPSSSGSFSLIVNDVFVQSGRTAPVLAGFSGSQTTVPEPATLLLLGTGLAGVASKLRKRRRASKSAE